MTKQKTKQKAIGVLLMFFCASISLSAFANAPGYMNLHSVGNSADESIALDNIRKITFSAESVDVWQKDQTTLSMPYTTLWKITFGAQLPSGIDEVQEAVEETIAIHYRSVDGCIVVHGKQPIRLLSVYTLQGALLAQFAPCIESAELPLVGYPAGIYIVRATDGKTIKTQKIIKK